MDTLIQKTISNLIDQQFDDRYRAEGPMFVEFVKHYFKWMESESGPLYGARRMSEYLDIDETVDDFIIHFKEQYLKNIQLETTTDTRRLVKHSLDLYRSKGNERSVSLLFALVFGEAAEVYYPREDIFRLSSGKWVKPKYIEVTPRAVNKDFVGKQLRGVKSGATAFVERLIRRRFKGKFAEIFYVSAISGEFQYGEPLVLSGMGVGVAPRMVGSVTSLTILSGGTGFAVGDLTTLESINGVQGVGRVSEVSDVTGIVEFTLEDGGWGFTANAEVLISEHVLTLSNVVPDVVTNITDFSYVPFEVVTQPMAEMQFEDASDEFVNGDHVFVYDSGGVVLGEGVVLTAAHDSANANNGVISVSILSGNLAANTDFYTTANAASAVVVSLGYTDETVTAEVIGVSSNVQFNLSNVSGEILVDSVMYQLSNVGTDSANGTVFSVDVSGNDANVRVQNAYGVFVSTKPVMFRSSNTTANVSSYSLTIGVVDTNGSFVATNNNVLRGGDGNTWATVSRISTGSAADFDISSTLLYPEEVSINTDLARTYANVLANAAAYGFPAMPLGNSSTPVSNLLSHVNGTIGTISALVGINPGVNYDTAPFVLIIEPGIAGIGLRDYSVDVADVSGSFSVGEIVEQVQSGGTIQGIVKASSNASTLFMKRLSSTGTFDTSNSIYGVYSSATANVVSVYPDVNSAPIGMNAIVLDEVQTGNGAVVTMSVHDSGYGYVQDEAVDFTSLDGERSGTARVTLGGHGFSAGFYKSRDGFLSSEKKLRDGRYYQEFSYEVRASVTLDKYVDMLKKTLHPAGFELFGSVVKKSVVDSAISLAESVLEVS